MALVKLYGARDELEAHYLRSLLEEAEIPATVMGQTLSVARGELPMTGETLPSVWVHERDVDRAMLIVEGMNRSEQDIGRSTFSPWTCPDCGEQVEGQFTHCWNCGVEGTGDD